MGMAPEVMKQLRIDTGSHCDACGTDLEPEVLYSAAGFYVGTKCKCGPYTRESTYFATRGEAEEEL